jgi:hypothetical protein
VNMREQNSDQGCCLPAKSPGLLDEILSNFLQ